MSVSHKNMPDAQRHEPKGASSATAGSVYVADGLGSGAWTNQLASLNNGNLVTHTVKIADISTPSSVFIPNPILGRIYKIYVTLQGTIAGADASVSAKINGVTATSSAITVTYTGSVAGSTFSSTPSGLNTVSAGGAIEIVTDGASTNAVEAIVCVVMDVS